jgi:hypothetical protein
MTGNMKRESVTAGEFETGLAGLRREIDNGLQNTQDRVLTAIFGFVNGASARMEALENGDQQLRAKIRALESRIAALEKRPDLGI